MHTHVARTTLDKLPAELDALMPPGDHDLGPLACSVADLVDLKVEYLGGRDVLAVAVHRDHAIDADVAFPLRSPIPESEFRDVPDPMVWARAFASRFTTGRLDGHGKVEALDPADEVAGLMVGWFSNFASAWERRVRERVAAETGPARVVVIRRQDNGWDRFAFVDDDGRMVAEFTVEPRCVSLIHDRPMPPEWLGIA